jgi:hypothetical protein
MLTGSFKKDGHSHCHVITVSANYMSEKFLYVYASASWKTGVRDRREPVLQGVRNDFNQWRTQEFFRGGEGSTNSVEDRGQREWGSGGGSHLVRGSAQFANE